MNIVITGATGFVGRFLCMRMLAEGWSVRGTLLAGEARSSLADGVEPMLIQPLGAETDWSHVLAGADTVIHLAARVHIMNDPAADPLQKFRTVNTEGTRRLAREAAGAGVKRLVFVSSIKVNGEETDVPYTEDSPARPSDPYGISKWEAEQALRQIESDTGLQVVVVRPTLAYGPGVKANFLNMIKAVSRGYPLPFGSITNRRSLIFVGNLVDALTCCAVHPAAAGQTYLVSDGEDVSTPELIRRTAAALGVPARLFPVPVSLMKLGGRIMDNFGFWILNFGRSRSIDLQSESKIQNSKYTASVNRLIGSLAVDPSKIKGDLGWQPPYSLDQGLRETARWFLERT